jgi:hypothetical protein
MLYLTHPARGLFGFSLEIAPRMGFAIGDAGLYHVGCASGAQGTPLFLLDPTTGRDRLVGTIESPAFGITVSADGRTILYGKAMISGCDLVLIENFR